MKAIFNGNIKGTNWTFGKEYYAKPSIVKGYASIIDDNGVEQLIRIGATTFLWKD